MTEPAPEGGRPTLLCSAKGCRRSATADLRWNNPKIHTPDRRKHWLACDEHTGSLGGFLSARGFLRDTVPVDEHTAEQRDRDDAAAPRSPAG